MKLSLDNILISYLPPANEVWGKVIFSHACHSFYSRGGWGGMHGRVCGRVACMAEGMHGSGHARQERRSLKRVVRILLECILVKRKSVEPVNIP